MKLIRMSELRPKAETNQQNHEGGIFMKHLFKCLAAGVTAVCMCMALAVPMESSADSIVLGDINNDGSISMMDLTHLNRYLAGQIELVDYVRADLNQNCVVDAVDANILLRYLTLSITSLPYTSEGGGMSSSSLGAESVNSFTPYTIFAADTGLVDSGYYLDANSVIDNSRMLIDGTENRYAEPSASGVVKIIYRHDGGTPTFASGFFVDEHVIATSAHCVFDKMNGNFQDSKTEILKIVIIDGDEQIEITDMYDVHVPNEYISTVMNISEVSNAVYNASYLYTERENDYALITIPDKIDPETNENVYKKYAHFNLGVMQNAMIDSSQKVYLTGFPGAGPDSSNDNTVSVHAKYTGDGYVEANVDGYNSAKMIFISVDGTGGNSGGPVYTKTEYNGNTYYTAIGIYSGVGVPYVVERSVRITTNLLHFYKNNPYIVWE